MGGSKNTTKSPGNNNSSSGGSNKTGGKGKGKESKKDAGNEAGKEGGSAGKLKPATAINSRHILVSPLSLLFSQYLLLEVAGLFLPAEVN